MEEPHSALFTMLAPLTPKQRQVLEAIVQSQVQRGFAPTLKELAATFGTSKITVREHVRQLAAKGYLRVTRYHARGLHILQIPPNLQLDGVDQLDRFVGTPALTPRQLAVLEFIVRQVDASGSFPRIKLLAESLGLTRMTIYGHLKRLEEKGVLGRATDGRSRVVLYHPPTLPAGGLPTPIEPPTLAGER